MGGKPWKSKGAQLVKGAGSKSVMSDSRDVNIDPLADKWTGLQCDLQRPRCAHCVKRNIICPGYPDNDLVVFAHYADTQHPRKVAMGRSTEIEPANRAQKLPHNMQAYSQIRIQLYASFLDSYYPMRLDINAIQEVDLWFQLVSRFITLPSKSKMLETAFSAISCFYFGSTNKDDQLLQKGMQLYNTAIRCMSNRVCQSAVTEDMVYTSVIFKAIETFHCPSGREAIAAHMEGHNLILKNFDDTKANSGMKCVYKLQKQGLMYAPLLFKGSGYDFDYLKKHNDDAAFDELFEVYVEITTLLATADYIDSSGKSDRALCENLVRRCRMHRAKTLEWYSRNLDSIGGPPICYPTGKLKNMGRPLPSSDEVFSHFYTFQSLRHAELHVFFWKAMVLLQIMIYHSQIRVLRHARDNVPNDFFNKSPTDFEAYSELKMSETYADNICRAIPYWLQNRLGSYGVLKITVNLWPVLKPYTHLRSWKKFRWVQHICKIVESGGNDLATCISQVWWKYWLLCQDPKCNFHASLLLREDYGERLNVSMEGDTLKVIHMTKDGELAPVPESLKIC
ncbi:hypothetical protein N7462_009405 [Penicillium macrosclerotiorum]|uniref:uncharacterized protein n=1 Tax=Penicillium macrosclerotiorum TaxID=303699 RepID=UPI002546717B|nr:uncharacterized protein N7462_009405 [Penicillium macrosclerotiorum]KAJ5673966.1 hypothetical protein N7462_009405 [Penicillium macrosclerotiorum]